MPLYVGDYLRDTRGLTAEQHGAYLLLMMSMWNAGGALPDDDRKLARFSGCTPGRWAKIRDEILSFFIVADGVIRHKRLGVELEKANEKAIKNRTSGSKGGRAKALKDKGLDLADAKANAVPYARGLPEPEPEKKETQADACVERASAPKPKPKPTRSRIPDGWRPNEAERQFARDKGLTDEQIDEEAAKLVDWARNATPDKALKSDWSAAWRNWIRNVVERSGRGPPGMPRQATAPSLNGYAAHDLRNHPNSVVAAADRLEERIRDFGPRPEPLGQGAPLRGGSGRG